MMAHQTKLHPDPSGRRLFVTNNYYTRHTLTKILKKETDEEARLLGTMNITNMKNHDKETLKKATEILEDKPSGSWVVCQVCKPLQPTRSSWGEAVVQDHLYPRLLVKNSLISKKQRLRE